MSKLGNSPIVTNCVWCGVQFKKPKSPSNKVRFCGRSCSAKWRLSRPEIKARLHTPENLAKLRAGRARAATGFGISRPSSSPETIAKIRATKVRNGTLHLAPRVLGGSGRKNGREEKLQAMLGAGWVLGRVIKTGRGGPGQPASYKLDVSNESLMVAVELDGANHYGEKGRARDRRRSAFLSRRGWWVFRFRNAMFDRHPEAVIRAIHTSTASKSKRPTTSSPMVYWSQTVNP